jgi:four helix bundle protein
MPIRTFRDLEVFKGSYNAALTVSQLCEGFPAFEQVELARQLRRAARSVPGNIAEGWAKRHSTAEFKRYLQNAFGSCQETQVWLQMSRDEGYIDKEKWQSLQMRYDRIGVMLHALWKKWKPLGQGAS